MGTGTKNDTDDRAVLFYVGFTLILLFSIVIGFLNIGVLYLLGAPVVGLIAGILLVWLSGKSQATKAATSLLPFPIILVSFLLFIAINRAEPETILIPANYRGQFTIYFDQPCGEPISYESGRRVYQIPFDGILVLNGRQTFGVLDRKFYLVDESGNQTEIPLYKYNNYDDEKESRRWTLSGKPQRSDVGVFWAYTNSFSFIVSNFNEIGRVVEQKEAQQKQFQDYADKKLAVCRGQQ